ncbi:hypothetical protein IGI04_021571, partial [Brassica rapa subsp. trilocularis]
MRASGTFDITSGAVDVFPEVSLSFGGGASTVLTPVCIFGCFLASSGGERFSDKRRKKQRRNKHRAVKTENN